MTELECFDDLVAEGCALRSKGDFGSARKLLERALVEGEAMWGPYSERLIAPLWQLAKLEHQTSFDSPKSNAAQIAQLRRAAAIADVALSRTDAQRIRILGSLAIALHVAELRDEASEAFAEALEALGTTDKDYRQFLLGGYVQVLLELQRFVDAEVGARELLDLSERPGSAELTAFEAWYYLGQSLLGVGRPAEAATFFRRCLEYQIRKVGDSPRNEEFRLFLEQAEREAANARDK